LIDCVEALAYQRHVSSVDLTAVAADCLVLCPVLQTAGVTILVVLLTFLNIP